MRRQFKMQQKTGVDKQRGRATSEIQGKLLSNLEDELGAAPQCMKNIRIGIASFLARKGLLSNQSIEQESESVVTFLQELQQLMNGQDFYKSNSFNYIYEGDEIGDALAQIMANARYWIEIMGSGFFERYSPHSRNRKTLMVSQIDTDFFLSAKAGSGMGAFSIDFAIGIEPKDYAPNVPSGEIWRSGIDTERTADHTSMRIIRTGSAIKMSKEKYEQKSRMYLEFKKRYGLSPQRALAFLAMYVGKDLDGIDEIKALSSIGVHNPDLHLIRGSKVCFDYSRLFQSVGFRPSENLHWLTIGNPQEGFYQALETTAQNKNGLRAYETTGLDKVLDAFRSLQSVTDSKKHSLTVCRNESRAELEKVIQTFMKINNR